jgi:hypothetical protein
MPPVAKKALKKFERSLTEFDRTAFRTFNTFAKADEADRKYWRSRSPKERMQALEHIRQMVWGYRDDSQPAFQTTVKVTELVGSKVSRARRVRS